MLIALSGTPGTGKSSVASFLRQQGFSICHLDELAQKVGACTSYDQTREVWYVDMDVLARGLPLERPLIIVGHYSHLLPVDMTIVIRCHPEVLRRRLQLRGWNENKIRENLEAEALGVITSEALGTCEVFEVDGTAIEPKELAANLIKVLEGKGDQYRVGKIDWSEVILDWY